MAKVILGSRKRQANDPVKKKINFKGIPIDIEWKNGEVRSFPGSPYKNPLHGFDYGYIRGTNTEDGEELDVYVKTKGNPNAMVYKVDQLHSGDGHDGEFDEVKYFLGFDSAEEAKHKYEDFMETAMFGGVLPLTFDQFKKKIVPFYQGAPDVEASAIVIIGTRCYVNGRKTDLCHR